MAERLPVGASRNIKSPSFTSLGLISASSDISNASIDRLNSQILSQEPESNNQLLPNGSNNQFLPNGSNSQLLTMGSNSQLLSNGSGTVSNRSSGHSRLAYSEATPRNGSKTKESDSRNDAEWVEQDEPGVYITLTSLPGGVKDLKRVRFRYLVTHFICLVFLPFALDK